jgi:predicted outer membrane protein
MKRELIGGAVAVVLAGAGVAGAQVHSGTKESPAGWPVTQEVAQRRTLAVTLPALVRVHFAHQLQAAIGRQAQQRGATAEVRRLGRLMAADHERATRALRAHAREQRGLDIDAVASKADKDGAVRRHLELVKADFAALSGAQFDDRFLTAVSGAHQDSLDLMSDAWVRSEDPALRTLLNRTAPVLAQHRQIAEALRWSRVRGRS